MLFDMGSAETADDILELRTEAANARKLAASFREGLSSTDLLTYAAALDREADELELELGSREKVRPFPSSMMRSEIAVGRGASQPLARAKFR